MGDLTGAGKIFEVIVNKIADVTGTLYEPTQIRRVGSAKADVEAELIIKRAKAEVAALRLKEESRAELQAEADDIEALRARASQRLITKEINRQANLERIVHESLQITADGESKNQKERSIDDDWIAAFIRYAQDISADGVRQIWSRILASQATQNRPAISKATLDALRLLEPRQAKVFERAVQLFISLGQIMDIEPHGDPEIAFNINTIEVMALEDIGFLKRVTSQETSLEFHDATLTFWKEYVVPGPAYGDDALVWKTELFWNTDGERDSVLQEIKAITAGETRDAKELRNHIRVDRLLLTSRGYELASILLEGFYEMLSQNGPSDQETIGVFALETTQKRILKEWAKQFAFQGAAVVLNRSQSKNEMEDGEEVTKTELLPVYLLDKASATWIEVT